MGRRRGIGAVVSILIGGAALALSATGAFGDADAAAPRGGFADGLTSVATGPHAELIGKLPIARRRDGERRSVLSVALPRLADGDRISFRGEVTFTTTCVDGSRRCIGRQYSFDPHLSARVVLAASQRAVRRTKRVSRRESVTCEQNRPNRNHHCPVNVKDQLVVRDASRLPCAPAKCRLNVIVDAYHPARRGGEVVIMGADTPSGRVEDDKARLSAVVARAGTPVSRESMRTRERRARTLPASGRTRVVLSQKLTGLRRGDILVVASKQRFRIRRLPYFLGSKIVVASRPDGAAAGRIGRRYATREGTATEKNGYNCTLGPSAFRNPCVSRKLGLVEMKRSAGPNRPLFLNVVSQTIPKLAQARGGYPPVRVGRGELEVLRLRAK